MIPSNHSFIEALTGDTRQAFYDQHAPIAHVMHLMLFAASPRRGHCQRDGRRGVGPDLLYPLLLPHALCLVRSARQQPRVIQRCLHRSLPRPRSESSRAAMYVCFPCRSW